MLPSAPRSLLDPPLAKSNQEVRGPRVLWTRSMPAGLPGPRAWERWWSAEPEGRGHGEHRGDRSAADPARQGQEGTDEHVVFKSRSLEKARQPVTDR